MARKKNKMCLSGGENSTHCLSNASAGFTLIELIVGLAVFGILLIGALNVYGALASAVKATREKVTVAAIAEDNLEIVRNLPYSKVGTINGNPRGSLPDSPNARQVNIQGTIYKIYYEVTYVHDPADPNPASADYKQVKMSVKNTSTGAVTDFLTNVAAKNLPSLNNAGALSIKVFNAVGQPISDANIHIQSIGLTPAIVLDRASDANGNWLEVGLPDNVNGYHIVVTKNGYSTDSTYPITAQNPNPTKPDATVATGTITQVSFAIDLTSNLTINTENQTCQPINAVNVNVAGAKLIGTNPNVLKYSNNFSSSAGAVSLNNIEWDTYTPTLLTGQSVMLYGSSPIQQISVLPASNQTFTLVLGPQTANSLLVIVKDSTTGLPLENATVHLQLPGTPPQDYYATTGGSVWVQQSWAGGSGQILFTDPTKYFSDDGNVDTQTIPTGLRLKQVSGSYVAAGQVQSSTFDSGTGQTQLTSLTWQPTSQDPAATVKFQIASNNDNATWNFVGPDGTSASYYTVSGTTVNPAQSNNRYIRYEAFLSTTDPTKTPVISNIDVNYVSGCYTPGQVIFPGLAAGSTYTLDISETGYQTSSTSNLNISGNQTLQILLSH